jgi:hypothetical protein
MKKGRSLSGLFYRIKPACLKLFQRAFSRDDILSARNLTSLVS